MKLHYDKKADALYIRFSDEKYFESEELKECVILDLDSKGKIIGVEILDVSENLPKKALSKTSFHELKEQVVTV